MVENLFAELNDSPNSKRPDELIELLAGRDGVRIERIVSTGHCSPPGFWYDQPEDEWVIVLKGKAKLLFADDQEAIEMGVGDHLLIHAHRRHRVEWTSPDEATVWLAVFYPPSR